MKFVFLLYSCLCFHTIFVIGKPRVDMDEHRMHHSNYRVSHHMGQMKIKANPEGADFDFSGGDLHVDLRPAHSEVVPIFNYFHSDYHHYDVQPIEHHIEHHVSHSGDEDYHMDHDHHGEDEEGYTRSYHHHEDCHHHHQQLDPYEHHHRHHKQLQDNDQRHGHMECMSDHSGHHEEHHHGHMMHDEDEEMEEDHGHHSMPHVFPVGMMGVGEAHHSHHGGSEGHHSEGHGGMHHEQHGNEGSHEYVGNHHDMEGGNVISPGDIGHHREESWGDNMGHYGVGDYGGGSHGSMGGSMMGGGGCGYKRDGVNCTTTQQRESVENNDEDNSEEEYTKAETKEETGQTRDFMLQKPSLDGSIRNKFKQHWNDDEKEANGEHVTRHHHNNDDEVDYADEPHHSQRHHHHHHGNDDDENDFHKETLRQSRHRHHNDDEEENEEKEEMRLRHHHRMKTKDDHDYSKPDADAKPTAEEFVRNYNFPKKIYPEDNEGSGGGGGDGGGGGGGGGGEHIESAYKVNDKLSAKELKLADEIDEEEKEMKRMKKRKEEEAKRREKEEEKEELKKEREELKKEDEKAEMTKDGVEEDIERREKEIQDQRAKAFSKFANDDDEEPDDPPSHSHRESSKHHPDELRWNQEMPVHDVQHAYHEHPGKYGIHGEHEGHHGSHPGDEGIHGDHEGHHGSHPGASEIHGHHEGDHDKEAADHEEEEHDHMNEEHDEHHDEEEEDKHAEEHEEEEHDHMNDEHDEHHDEEEEDRHAEDHEEEEHEEMDHEHDHEEEHEHGHHFHHKDIDDEYEKEMDPEEKKEHDFHESITSQTMNRKPKFQSLEKPHNGVERFQDNGEEIDINDRTREGDVDQMMIQNKLEEDTNQLPVQNDGERDALKMLGDGFKPYNAKEELDNLQNGMYEQNQDPKLEGSDHDFYHDHSNFVSSHQHKSFENMPEPERFSEANNGDESNKRHALKLKQPITVTGTQNDVVEPPHADEEVDKKILGDFKSRFNEETSFQSVEQAEELFNHLQDAAMENQKALDSTQTSGSVNDNGLVSRHAGSTNNLSAKRHSLNNQNKAALPKKSIMADLEDARKLSETLMKAVGRVGNIKLKRNKIAKHKSKKNNSLPKNSSLNKVRSPPGKERQAIAVMNEDTYELSNKRHELFLKNFFGNSVRNTQRVSSNKIVSKKQIDIEQRGSITSRRQNTRSSSRDKRQNIARRLSVRIPYFKPAKN